MTPERVRAAQQRCNDVLGEYSFPVLAVDGVEGPLTRQALGAVAMVEEFRRTRRRHPGRWTVVDKTFQVMVAGERDGSIRFVLPVTTGRAGFETRVGDRMSAFRYEPAADNQGWRNSTTFPVDADAGADGGAVGNMYRPIYFDRGMAIHGSRVVPSHPNSNGCVCVAPAHQDLLVSWVGLDDRITTSWDTQRIDLTVTVRGSYRYDDEPVVADRDVAGSDESAPVEGVEAGEASSTAHLPDARQDLLVRAAVFGGDAGRDAWVSWFEQAPAGAVRFDHGSERLLPLVARTMLKDGAEIPGRDLLVARYRQSSYTHNRLLHRAKPAISVLHDAGLDVMIVKGVSLAARFYGDRGARWISDVDIVVREEQAFDALDVLLRSGWRSMDSAVEVLRRSHAVGLVDDNGGSIDLHRRMLQVSRAGLDAPVWDRAVVTTINGMSVSAPCAADELLFALVHGWAWSSLSTIRWIPDAAAVMAHMGPDDWRTLVDEARRREVSYRVVRALDEVHRRYDLPVPAEVLEELAGGPFASFEEAEERWHLTPYGRVPPGVGGYYDYVRQTGPPSGVGWWIGLAKRYVSVARVPEGANVASWLAARLKRVAGAVGSAVTTLLSSIRAASGERSRRGA